jgi:hypothetical protein
MSPVIFPSPVCYFDSIAIADSGSTDLYIAGFVDFASGIPENKNEDAFSINPNPAASEINIQNISFISEQIEVFNSTGERVLFSLNSCPSMSRESGATLDISQLSRGIYLVAVKGKKEMATAKVHKGLM